MDNFKPVVLVISAILTVFLMVCGLTSPSLASEEVTVTVEGKGDVRVIPDMALLDLGVETIAPTAKDHGFFPLEGQPVSGRKAGIQGISGFAYPGSSRDGP